MEIKVQNVNFKYKGSKRQVLSNMYLELQENRICGLLGKNGVGKSTLLYLIAGLLRPTKGMVTVDDMDSADRKPEMLSEMFFVSEEFELPSVRLADYVKMNAPFYPRFSQELLENALQSSVWSPT